jgi:cleavage and polyadenylation specificity factor subunit 2
MYIHDDNSFSSFKSFAINPAFHLIILTYHSGPYTPHNNLQKYDIVIIGSGLAGLTAAYKCAELNSNCKICVIEKESSIGGNSLKATSGVNCCCTPLQEKLKVVDSYDLFYSDTIKSGKGKSNLDLVTLLVNKSTECFHFFQSLGLELNQVSMCGGHSAARTHKPKEGPVGYNLVMAVYNKIVLLYKDRVKFITEAKLSKINYNASLKRVIGITVTIQGVDTIIDSAVVILCTGGFSNDKTEASLLQKYAPNLIHFPTTNGRFTEGDGVKVAEKINAQLIDMEQVQVHPTGFIDPSNETCPTKFLAPELLRGVGAILINQKGNRFCNELGYRDYVTECILKNCENRIAYLLIGEEGASQFGPNFFFYVGKQFIKKFESLKFACDEWKVDYNTALNEIESYNKNNCSFGKTVFPTKILINSVIYIAKVTPCIHYTMGGLKFNTKAEILGADNSIIESLYGAGEVTGGLHGANRLAGNSLLECYVFGSIAGVEAAKKIGSAKL